MAFDEQGQADTAERKFEICRRAYHILINELDYDPQDIIFDPNIFAVATGISAHDNYAMNYLEATREIKSSLLGALVSGGATVDGGGGVASCVSSRWHPDKATTTIRETNKVV